MLSDKDQVQAYLDGDLTPDQVAVFERRLRTEPQLAELLVKVAREEAIILEWAHAHAVSARVGDPNILPFSGVRRGRLAAGLLAAAAAAAVFFMLGFGVPPSPQPATEAAREEGAVLAKLEDVQGEVYVVPARGAPIKAQSGQVFKSGQGLKTGGDGSSVVLAFADTARFELSTDTTIHLTAPPIVSDQPMTVYLVEGSVAAEVTGPAVRPMVLATPHAEARLSETRTNVTTAPRGTRVEQERGQLQMTRKSDGQSIAVPTGWFAVAPANGTAPFAPQRMPDPITKARLFLKDVSPGPVHDVAYSPDGTVLAAACSDGHVKFWNLVARISLPSLKVASKNPVRSIAYSPDGTLLAATGDDRLVKMFASSTGFPVASLKGHKTAVMTLAFSPDGQMLVSAGGSGRAAETKVWNVATQMDLGTLAGHSSVVLAAAFSPDSRTLATSSRDGSIHLWDVPGLQLRHTLLGHVGPVGALAFSPDGSTLASAGKDLTVKLWDRATGDETGSFTGLVNEVRAVAFSPDGRLLAAADNNLRLWNIASGQAVSFYRGHKNAIFSIAFSPDGREIASAGWDKSIRIWDVPVLPPQE
jgi:ferric-dicitrate binding protein FerR (iron transport regulator)